MLSLCMNGATSRLLCSHMNEPVGRYAIETEPKIRWRYMKSNGTGQTRSKA